MKGQAEVVDRLATVGRTDVGIPQPVIAEISYGLQRLPPSRRRAALQATFDAIRGELMRIEWTDEVSEAFGTIKSALERKGTRIEDFDVAIAAHAVARDATLVTANRDRMERVPDLKMETWLAGELPQQ